MSSSFAFIGSGDAATPRRGSEPRNRRRRNSRLGLLLLAVGAGAMLLGAAVYAATRPCVLSGCVGRFDRAESLETEALQRLRNEPSTTNLERGWQQLAIAREVLEPIPAWSRHDREANERLAALTRSQDDLRATIAGLSYGWEAAQLSQEPPHPLERWQEMEALWARAIATLEGIPDSNAAYPVAQTKLVEYRQHLEAIRRRTVLERRAEEDVAAARLAAEVAVTRQENAASLGEWQQAHASWQLAIESLMRVPGGTTGSEAAQSLLTDYTPQRDIAHRQREREQTGALRYQRATEAADRARTALDGKRWQESIGFWQQAIANLRAVPTQSSYAENARAALESHTRSLAQTVATQEMALHLAQISKNLTELCRAETPICSFAVSESQVVVRLKPEYLATVRDLDRQAAENQSTETRVQLERHLQSTIDALESIGDSAGIPLEVLAPDGKLLARHAPDASETP